MPDDTAELCCAAGICCDTQKRRKALANILIEHVEHLAPAQAVKIADVVHDFFDISPKDLGLGDFMMAFAKMAREYDYK